MPQLHSPIFCCTRSHKRGSWLDDMGKLEMAQKVYCNTSMLEQVTDLVHRMMIKQLPQIAWDTLRMFEFSDGEEVIQMLQEYLESAIGRNAKFLE